MAKPVEYWATMEEQMPTEATDIALMKNKLGLQYVRFKTCLQAFVEKYNRNKRAWKPEFIATMINGEVVQEQLRNGGVPGEAGHPVPTTGQPTLERICTIDPMNVSHLVTSFEWRGGKKYLDGVVETYPVMAGDSMSPGARLMNFILANKNPAFSARTIVPQKKMPDGTTQVLGPGRLLGYDWVYGPSHKEAYIDRSVKVDLVNKDNFNVNYATESAAYAGIINEATQAYTAALLEASYNVNSVLDRYDPALETATVDREGIFSCNTHDGGRLFIPTEENFRKEIRNFMLNINN